MNTDSFVIASLKKKKYRKKENLDKISTPANRQVYTFTRSMGFFNDVATRDAITDN